MGCSRTDQWLKDLGPVLALPHMALGTSHRAEQKKPRLWNHMAEVPSCPSSAGVQIISSQLHVNFAFDQVRIMASPSQRCRDQTQQAGNSVQRGHHGGRSSLSYFSEPLSQVHSGLCVLVCKGLRGLAASQSALQL